MKNRLHVNTSKKIKIEFHDIDRSILEACMSRGDRRTGKVIYAAWRKGARMDGWTEFFDFSIWEEAFMENELDIYSCAGRTYALGSALPWSHIKAGTADKALKEELEKSGFYEKHVSVAGSS